MLSVQKGPNSSGLSHSSARTCRWRSYRPRPSVQVVSGCHLRQRTHSQNRVRTWRQGDELTAIHWPATLRSGEFVVRQRISEVAQRWTVPAQTGTADASLEAARVRDTLAHGLALGRVVALRRKAVRPLEVVGLRRPSAVHRWSREEYVVQDSQSQLLSDGRAF